jgi:catechol 2,3-dioxygenase-like lactoylglutathione lyase family enzyme
MPYRFESLAPMLQAADLDATVAWYTSVLGFKCSAQEEGWARLERDEVALMFITDEEFGSPQATGVQYIYVDDAMALWNDIKNRVRAERGPEQTDYGMLEFTIKDPNGYLLSFGQSTEGQGR